MGVSGQVRDGLNSVDHFTVPKKEKNCKELEQLLDELDEKAKAKWTLLPRP